MEKQFMLKHYKASFLARNLTTYQAIFRRKPTGQEIFSPSDFTWTVNLLRRMLIHLNMSLTGLKSNICWNTI